MHPWMPLHIPARPSGTVTNGDVVREKVYYILPLCFWLKVYAMKLENTYDSLLYKNILYRILMLKICCAKCRHLE